MASLDMASFDAALKELYSNDAVINLTYQDRPFLAMVPKSTDFDGDGLSIVTSYGDTQGRSSSFATAQTNATASKHKRFTITRVQDYAVATIDNETMMASKSKKGAFLDAAQTEIDASMNNLTNSLSHSLYRSGTGSIGQVNNSSFATTGLDLVTDIDADNFEVGQTLQVSATDGGAARTGTLTVDGVDRLGTSNQITTSANLSTGISAIAQNDYIFVEGDTGSKLSGLQAWCPDSTPSATSFFGVDRTADAVRLGGVRYDGSAIGIEEALINAAALLQRFGGSPDVVFLHPDKFRDLVISLENRVRYADVREAGVGFSGIEIIVGGKPIKILPDRFCPKSRAFMLQLNTWKLHSLGGAPQILRYGKEGLMYTRQSGADGVEVRMAYYAQLGCKAPGFNCNINLG